MSDEEPLDGRDMIARYLKEHGFDGLYDPSTRCSCELSELMPCQDSCAISCLAGHKTEGCSADCGDGCDYHIGEKKEEEA